MSLRDRLLFRKATPAPISDALQQQGMDNRPHLGPGVPLQPATGYSLPPRSTDYPVGVNISLSPRTTWGRTSYETLRAVIDAYDVARMCINHKIDEIRSMEPLFQPADGVTSDVAAAIDAAKAVIASPDREHPYDEWIALALENSLRYDALALYRRRNRAGQIIGLEVVDGTTVYPFIDAHGRRPAPPAPAFWQRIKGLDDVWFTTDDLSFELFRPQPGSPFGLAPVESILLTANTDLRFQWHFLQMFTDGTLPAGLMTLPEDISSPDQVAEWQEYWDAFTRGDQSILHRLIAVPAGTTITNTKPESFDSQFSEYLMTRTAAAFGVVPQDLGLVADVNRANGETQVDIQFRVNTLPWVLFVQRILNRFLQRDLGLPVKVRLDTGRDTADRLEDAQVWEKAVASGAVSADEWRAEMFGLPVDNDRPVPRGIISSRLGFVPLVAMERVAGPLDPETISPADGVPLDATPFNGTDGVLPAKLPGGTAFRRAPTDPEEPAFPQLEAPVPGTDVVAPPVVKSADAELVAFRKFAAARRRRGSFRPFVFHQVSAAHGRELNRALRVELTKGVGVAGLAVVARDTGRVLMIQRALDPDDPAQGTWEVPGGHLEGDEEPLDAAKREWQEETGQPLPDGQLMPGWESPDGKYAAFVWAVDAEADVPVRSEGTVLNPDDPDGDCPEAIAWFSPSAIVGNPTVRPEMAAQAPMVLRAVVQAVDAVPFQKAGWRDAASLVPQHRYDLRITDHYQGDVQKALREWCDTVPVAKIASSLIVKASKAPPDVLAHVIAQLQAAYAGVHVVGDLEQVIRRILVDGWLTGQHGAAEQTGTATAAAGSVGVDWDRWEPGDTAAAEQAADGGMRALLDQAGITVRSILDTNLDRAGNIIARGLASGDDVASIGRALRDVVASPSRAEMIAHTETARAQSAATMATFTDAGVQQWDLLTSPGAESRCMAVADANPHPMSDTSGIPPIHPRCRCAVSPHLEGV